ncbi:MAG TPA: PilZ domain-containing protein [Lachnospiraceae bacterium]|nr:PilZ domain-containing protein [Lachnospiraceae bacterium]
MVEKRKAKRIVLNAHVIIKRLDSRMHERIPVDVTDLSKTGIGFKCSQKLELNSMYEAELVLWTKETINCFINITRADMRDDEAFYGAAFVGMTEHDACKIDIYDMFEGAKKQ